MFGQWTKKPNIVSMIENRIAIEDGTAKVQINGGIGSEVDGNMLASEIQQLDNSPEVQQIDLLINSSGGAVMDALSIYNAVKNANVETRSMIEGVAASAAALIAFAADKVMISETTGAIMIHEARSSDGEEDEAVQRFNDIVKNIIRSRTGWSENKVSNEVSTDNWFMASEAVEAGLADETFESPIKETPVAATAEQFQKIVNQQMDKIEKIKSGDSLGNRMEDLIERMATDDRDRADIVGELAQNAGLSESTVNSILNGNVQCPPIDRLEAFAEVLQVDASTLRNAAEEDGCDYEPENHLKMKDIRNELGLDSNAPFSEVKAEVDKLKEAKDQLEKDLESYKNELQEKKDKEAEAMIDEAHKLGKIDDSGVDSWKAKAKEDPEGISNMLDAIPSKKKDEASVSAAINKESPGHQSEGGSEVEKLRNDYGIGEDKGLRDLEKEDPKKVVKIRNEAPALYRDLFKKSFNREPKSV